MRVWLTVALVMMPYASAWAYPVDWTNPEEQRVCKKTDLTYKHEEGTPPKSVKYRYWMRTTSEVGVEPRPYPLPDACKEVSECKFECP